VALSGFPSVVNQSIHGYDLSEKMALICECEFVSGVLIRPFLGPLFDTIRYLGKR